MTSWWPRWRLKSPASRLSTEPFFQGADQRKHQSSASLAFVRGINRWPVNSPHKWPVTRKMFSFDDVIMHISCPKLSIGPSLWLYVCAIIYRNATYALNMYPNWVWLIYNIAIFQRGTPSASINQLHAKTLSVCRVYPRIRWLARCYRNDCNL